MTKNAHHKRDVRLFADINGLNYTGALRQFDPETGLPLFQFSEETPASRHHADEQWGEARGLKLGQGDACFHELSSTSGQVRRGYRTDHFGGFCGPGEVGSLFKDHPRSYLFRGPNDRRIRTAVIKFAPYAHWDNPELHSQVSAIADQFDVHFRIGMTGDATYGNATVPVVFWNPRVITLP